MSRPVAVITGASSGIGAELAKVFAAQGYDLVLCARRQERLQELADQLIASHPGTQVLCKALDLSKRKAPHQLLDFVRDLGLDVDVLVNNAGAAYQGRFTDMNREDVQQMASLNMRAVADLTHLFLPDMLQRGAGRILNVASVVGFQAIPGMTMYSASKAFVLSLTEGLAEELYGTGVKVCAVCPGLTRTELVKDLGTDKLPGSELVMADPAAVAKESYRALMRGDTVYVTGCVNQLATAWSELQPRWLKRRLSGLAARATLSRVRPASDGVGSGS